MKTFLWKLRYAFYFKRQTFCDWSLAWNDACASAEEASNLEDSPIEVADWSIDAWVNSQ